MNKSQSTRRRKNHNTHTSDIDDMDALLDHIDEFSQFVKSHEGLTDEHLQEEWQLFKTYLQWRIDDLTEDSYIYPRHKHNS
jgi:hypothetical protein